MPKRIAVETQLSAVEEALREKGYDVVQLDPLSPTGAELQDLLAVIITGQDENMLGQEDMQTQAPVIDARGLTTDEIIQQVEGKLRLALND